MTGMRSWIVEVTAFGVVVRMEQVFIHSPLGHLTNLEAEWLLGFPPRFHSIRDIVTTPPQTRTVFRFIAVEYYTAQMSKHLESLYQNLLNGKLPHNLSWSEAVELVEHLGEVQPHGDDEFVFIVGGQRAFFKKPHTHDLGVEEISRLRKFLKDARQS